MKILIFWKKIKKIQIFCSKTFFKSISRKFDFSSKKLINFSGQAYDNGIVRMRASGCDVAPGAASTTSSTSSHHSTAANHQPWFHSMISRENTEK